MMHLYPKESFKIILVDLYTQTAGNKATGKQNFKIFQDLCGVCYNAGPGKKGWQKIKFLSHFTLSK